MINYNNNKIIIFNKDLRKEKVVFLKWLILFKLVKNFNHHNNYQIKLLVI